MNRDNEEQKSIPQTFCGALQKEVNFKCLILSILIYGCLAAVTWCRCAIVTKIVTEFTPHPIRFEKLVSPCDDGYIYIPVAFMGMLYLVYLVECYHSPIRIDLSHAGSQNGILSKLTQLKLAQPTIWWKAISYHYVRRKRQITRYRNGDNYTTTQVYYERVNTHAATSFYFYDYCGVKDISRDLILDPKIPITKITLTKGFAFSNVRSATEFEEARSRFFAEQEFRDDYLEMREGLDLGYNFNPITLVAVLGNPWFTNSYVYWCLSALLLSWPLRLIIEYKTQYVDYQITKLFGINYDTPMSLQIHTSASQLSAPGSYMLAPSYSEALLMDPTSNSMTISTQNENPSTECEIIPSYSEALLYERVHEFEQNNASVQNVITHEDANFYRRNNACKCSCDAVLNNTLVNSKVTSTDNCIVSHKESLDETEKDSKKHDLIALQSNLCEKCLNCSVHSSKESDILVNTSSFDNERTEEKSNIIKTIQRIAPYQKQLRNSNDMMRDISEPDLRVNSEFAEMSSCTLSKNGRSLEYIIENDEYNIRNSTAQSERVKALFLIHNTNTVNSKKININKGAIPKRFEVKNNKVTVNPISEAVKRIPTSKTYFCLKSILKHNRRRYTLVTTEEFQSLAHGQGTDRFGKICKNLDISSPGVATECSCLSCRSIDAYRDKIEQRKELPASLKRKDSYPINNECIRSRTLIFASPIQEICSSDPFGGRNHIPSENPQILPRNENNASHPIFQGRKRPFLDKKSFNFQLEENLYCASNVDSATIGLLSPVTPHQSITVLKDDKLNSQNVTAIALPVITSSESVTVEQSSNNIITTDCEITPRLTRSLTERRYPSEPHDRILRKSFTERVDSAPRSNTKRTNLNMETSL